MRLRFQADENLDGRVISGLRRVAPELDFRSAANARLIGLADPIVLRSAAETQRVLVSQDRRTIPAHFRDFIESATSPGVLLLREGVRH